jgi:hypothetical protein
MPIGSNYGLHTNCIQFHASDIFHFFEAKSSNTVAVHIADYVDKYIDLKEASHTIQPKHRRWIITMRRSTFAKRSHPLH